MLLGYSLGGQKSMLARGFERQSGQNEHSLFSIFVSWHLPDVYPIESRRQRTRQECVGAAWLHELPKKHSGARVHTGYCRICGCRSTRSPCARYNALYRKRSLRSWRGCIRRTTLLVRNAVPSFGSGGESPAERCSIPETFGNVAHSSRDKAWQEAV